MASVSVSHLIIFIAAMIVAASVAGSLTSTVGDITRAIDEQGPAVSDDIRSDITIINDAGSDVVNGGTIELFVKNTGSSELRNDTGAIDVFVNGQFKTVDSSEVLTNDDGVWGRNDVARINVTDTSPLNDAGENRVKLVVDGAEDTFIWEKS